MRKAQLNIERSCKSRLTNRLPNYEQRLWVLATRIADKQNRAAEGAPEEEEHGSEDPPLQDYGCESGRRLRVGRSSSVLLGSLPVGCFLDCSVLVRREGLPGALSETLRENMMLRMRAISFCVFSMRSGVGGCVEKTLGMVPGRRFSSAWMRSKKVM